MNTNDLEPDDLAPEESSVNEAQPNTLVEHFFRHEYANLVSVLTRAFGISRIDDIEDCVQSAIIQAMNSWKQSGVPNQPAAWIHRVARNRILDSMRRKKSHDRAISLAGMSSDTTPDPELILDQWLDQSQLPDSLLRMMFVCCHPSLERKSQIALTLKILCGFSVNEIAKGLLIKPEAAKKRIQRAKAQLASQKIQPEFPPSDEIEKRLSAVHDVLYLMFNEGYCSSNGNEPIRDDVCEEAARLCHLLCTHETIGTSESKALLALMLFHASRLDSRTDAEGNMILLDEQDRETWDRKLIAVADQWLVKSVSQHPSRFHYEAVIAQFHCAAPNIESTDWNSIVLFYDQLLSRYPSPVYRLNRAIAIGQAGDLTRALSEIQAIRETAKLKDYFLLDCAEGSIHELAGDHSAATDCYLAAMSNSLADYQKASIEKKLKELSDNLRP